MDSSVKTELAISRGLAVGCGRGRVYVGLLVGGIAVEVGIGVIVALYIVIGLVGKGV